MVLATEPFVKLLTVMLRARQAPDAIAVVIKGNPEYLDAPAVGPLADRVLDEVVRRLAGGDASVAMIE